MKGASVLSLTRWSGYLSSWREIKLCAACAITSLSCQKDCDRQLLVALGVTPKNPLPFTTGGRIHSPVNEREKIVLYMYRVRTTRAALITMPPIRRQDVLDEVTRQAEAMAPGEGEWFIFDIDEFGLKAVVNFHDKTIWVMTPNEYRDAGLPQQPPRQDG